MLKKIVFPGVILFLILIIAGVVLFFNLDKIFKMAIEKGGSHILGVETRVDKADVSVFGGTIDLYGLELGSPKKFEAKEMLEIGHAKMDVKLGSFRGKELLINEVLVDDAEMTVEIKDGKTNWQVLARRLESKKDEEKSKKRIRIERVAFEDGTVKMAGLPGGVSSEFALPNIEITDLSAGGDGGLPPTDLFLKLIVEVYEKISGKARKELPKREVERISDSLGPLIKGAGEILKDSTEGKVGDEVNEILKGGEKGDEEGGE
ncbi:MAG: hypothetical protein KGZ25_07095 [Planctomycetes bacterium]|nr:hypothetical protein [Planctomycetota bacterium]